MSLQNAALEHSLNVIRREISDEFPDLKILFLLHEPGGRAQVLNEKKDELMEMPAGDSLYALLRVKALEADDRSCFGGIAHLESKRLGGLIKKDQFLAAIFINVDDIENDEHVAFNTKHLAYQLIWEGLDLYLQYKKKPDQFTEHGILRKPLKGVEWLRSRMLADCFATMAMESTGEKNAIQRVIKKRCELCLATTPGYNPEDYPFPLALDATLLVYKDLKDAAPPKTGPLTHTIFMAREIGDTYEDASFTQWVTFCRAAQKMAWMGHNKTEILGAAVYSNEDPYIRSTAYIVAETLNSDPMPLKNHDFFNPFADEAFNERLHIKRAKALFPELIERTIVYDDPSVLVMAIRHQNAELMEGNPAGWCSIPLIRAYRTFKTHRDEHITTAEAATNVFYLTLENLPWSKIATLHRRIIAERRAGRQITHDFMLEMTKPQSDLADFGEAFIFTP